METAAISMYCAWDFVKNYIAAFLNYNTFLEKQLRLKYVYVIESYSLVYCSQWNMKLEHHRATG
jgi:hypothetical protein